MFNESWKFLGGRKFNSAEGNYLGVEIYAQNAVNQPPVRLTCLCSEKVADALLSTVWGSDLTQFVQVRWSSRKKKWYAFVREEWERAVLGAEE